MWRRSAAASTVVAVTALIQAGEVSSCNVDLTTRGMPMCLQDCQEWCWATVISEFEAYYTNQDQGLLQAQRNYCKKKECELVSQARGVDCCAGLGKNGRACSVDASLPATCWKWNTDSNITALLNSHIPGKDWRLQKGAVSESKMQELLMSGNPIARLMPGHIDAIVGCRPASDGSVEYKMIDSEDIWDPTPSWWQNYSTTVYGYNSRTKPIWIDSIYAHVPTTVANAAAVLSV